VTGGGGVGLGVDNGAGGRAGGRHAGGVDRICAAATGLDRKVRRRRRGWIGRGGGQQGTEATMGRQRGYGDGIAT